MLRNAVIAAMVGATCGAAAAYWSRPIDLPDQRPVAVAVTPPVAVSVRPVGHPAAPPALLAPSPQRPTAGVSPGTDDPREAVQRARLLAQRPDVTGLVALRERMIRRAEEAGETESPAIKAQLDEIDRYLAEARVLRLKLDAAEFRTTPHGGTPPR